MFQGDSWIHLTEWTSASSKKNAVNHKNCLNFDSKSFWRYRKSQWIQRGNKYRNVHSECEKIFCTASHIYQAISKCKYQTTPSKWPSMNIFQDRNNCLFCWLPDSYSGKKYLHKLISVRTMGFKNRIMEICKSQNEHWPDTTMAQIEYVHGFRAVDDVYHKVCTQH